MPVDGLDWAKFPPTYLVGSQPIHASIPTYTAAPFPEGLPPFPILASNFPMATGAMAGGDPNEYTQTSPFRRTRWVEEQTHIGTVSPKELRRNPSPLGHGKAAPPFNHEERRTLGPPASTRCTEDQIGHVRQRKVLPSSPPRLRSATSASMSAAGHLAAHVSASQSRSQSRAAQDLQRKLLPGTLAKSVEPGQCARRSTSVSSSTTSSKSSSDSPKSPSHASDAASNSGESRRRDSASKTAAAKDTDPPSGVRGVRGQKLSAKDEFLVRRKLQGMTYRQIRLEGGFTEAESTLRGRFRTLTKSKEARVRKPAWTENDISLLQKAVQRYSKGKDAVAAKIPWKLVADYIVNHGGSYHFGNATCRKKWDEISFQTVNIENE
ncbi:hypothetical protein jhhlp_002141 [Lomentospora prolificans]|uniref:Myb-like domain-containing protein n=1 Tax=Lomentospora prolificans TaxID=41688 RepID=A0A2N3ND76_9PEZI|nr:hypothetical protein jhhlp_002141 [Lomentospora prolificans]